MDRKQKYTKGEQAETLEKRLVMTWAGQQHRRRQHKLTKTGGKTNTPTNEWMRNRWNEVRKRTCQEKEWKNTGRKERKEELKINMRHMRAQFQNKRGKKTT